ncbi:MAG: hypothetical protein WAN87_06300 [Thermoplasmata archaeon]
MTLENRLDAERAREPSQSLYTGPFSAGCAQGAANLLMEELICSVEFLRGSAELVARVSSEAGGVREYRGPSAGAVIDQVINDLQEEFESAPAI